MAGPRHDPTLYRERDVVPIRRALVSVSDKTDLLRLAEALVAGGVEIVSTGSTAATIRDAGHPVTDVASVTGFPESLDGRVKTLHPGVDSGPILAQERIDVLPGDDERSLHERIKTVERRLLIDVVRGVATGELDLAAIAGAPHPDAASSTHASAPSDTSAPAP